MQSLLNLRKVSSLDHWRNVHLVMFTSFGDCDSSDCYVATAASEPHTLAILIIFTLDIVKSACFLWIVFTPTYTCTLGLCFLVCFFELL